MVRFIWFSLGAALLFFNLRLYAPSPLPQSRSDVPPGILAQLASSRVALGSDAPQKMQSLFPEGYYFSHLLYGLTWIEVAMRDPSYRDQALEEAKWVHDKLCSPEGKAPFPASLPPDHGMFYSAWKCHLQAGIVAIAPDNETERHQLREECDAISAALTNSRTPFLPSYVGTAWPCDSVPAIHALKTYDRITGESRYQQVIANWLAEAQQRVDKDTGLLPHMASLPDGRNVSEARGTSQMVMLRMLPDIDPVFAAKQYTAFRPRYLNQFLGIPAVREYPTGMDGVGDVDSGPLIFGNSLSSTVMMVGVAQIYGDSTRANAMAQVGETIGLPWTQNGRKFYMGGALPLGDIIVSYSYIARTWFSDREHITDTPLPLSRWWRWQVHALSTIWFVPFLPALFQRRKQKHSELKNT
ncbi:MAG: hypothetical protein SFV81_04605 [Pirellulaceae bacterium]|nr:hypothetical protein [Pirellulaceae bacterium]